MKFPALMFLLVLATQCSSFSHSQQDISIVLDQCFLNDRFIVPSIKQSFTEADLTCRDFGGTLSRISNRAEFDFFFFVGGAALLFSGIFDDVLYIGTH